MPRPAPVPPTVVLVHGAFTDASSWSGVVGPLRAAGLTVHAPANPLRGLAHDAARLRSLVRELATPVVLVGHGYGGAVITQPTDDADQVVALCYVAGFGLDAGECVLDITNRFAPSPLADAAATTLLPAGPDSEVSIRAERFRQLYADDLSPAAGRALAAAQRPVACGALTDRSALPAWADKPSWYAIATADRMLNPAAQRFMAQRMAATEYVLDASHAAPLARPEAVVAMIREATAHTTGTPGGV
ncbi:alpha/beta fold hydrolase [Streptomyces rubellomurinus]|uniref:Alpha/beta hydrolase n=1 Tax=Streptomyces rubellomurinus (strain ATCC 31215) TaxID=359131 RepID=A0A0F2TQ67_STRR3|nr:alpha/beta hydrolase [Streptomyces rubellomurinus]KJS63867.1 alpha/beta hydrolase [Streptomyces rubellomurinus]